MAPTVDLCRHEDFFVDRLHLLHPAGSQSLCRQVVEDIKHLSPNTEITLEHLELADAWDFDEVYAALHAFAKRFVFRRESEEYLVHTTTGSHVAQICLFLLTESRHLPAKLLQTSPPTVRGGEAGRHAIIDLDVAVYDKLATRFADERAQGHCFLKGGIVTKSPLFNTLIEQMERVAVASRAPLLIGGPTGAGKTILARRIYELKRRRNQLAGHFVEVNCATLRGDTAMSTLFGHTCGAFTGATQEREGLLRRASGGMLFLDEVGELGPDEQAMLLRGIEEGRFMPVGADEDAHSDFQLIAGTNRDLKSLVVKGVFREDLLNRLSLWSFRLPSLVERPEDIAPNLDHELAAYSKRNGRQLTMNREARTRFLDFATSPEAIWSGNFRDFGGAIERMGTFAPAGRIDETTVDDEIGRLRVQWQPPSSTGEDRLTPLIGRAGVAVVDRFDLAQLHEVVAVCRASNSLSAAGRALFQQSRLEKKSRNDADRLCKYLARFGLSFAQITAAG